MSEETFIREVELDHLTRPLIIHQQTVGDVGGVVWDGALVLVNFLSKFKPDFFAGATVLELGTGTGLVGIVCATKKPQKVLVTDLPEFRELAERNISTNKDLILSDCTFEVLDWNKPEDYLLDVKPKLVLASECVYYEEAIAPLVNTLDAVTSKDSTVFVSFEFRDNEKNIAALKKFMSMVKIIFTVKEVPIEEHHEHFRSDDIKILMMRKKTAV